MRRSIDPAAYGIRLEDNRVGGRAAVALIVLFVLIISLPGLLREFSADAVRGTFAQIGDGSDGTVVDRLRAAEKRVDGGAWTTLIRQHVQTVLYTVFHEGNRKVVVGRDGWLFHRPGIRALTGRGPVLGPTHSVAKDHSLKNWEGSIPVIRDFAAQLKERGIQLVLVPVPDKAASIGVFNYARPRVLKQVDNLGESYFRLKRRGELPVLRVLPSTWAEEFHHGVKRLLSTLGPNNSLKPLVHPDARNLLAALSPDIRVTGTIQSLYLFEGIESVSYLRTDTHWDPITPRKVAKHVVEQQWSLFFPGINELPIRDSVIGTLKTSEGTDVVDVEILDDAHAGLMSEVSGAGDLWRMLGTNSNLPRKQDHFRVDVTTPAVSDPTSPVVLLGDSNVNIYDDPSLPFYLPGAGFGSWLSAYLGRSLHIIAINGGGATQVRQRFAALPDDVVRTKKIVIWVIAERDLFMDPAVARENGVEWKRVAFNPNQSQPAATPGDAIVVEATLKAKSALVDPGASPYEDAVFAAEFTVDKVTAGTYAESEVVVVLWNFRKRLVQSSARLPIGGKVRLTLVPWLSKGDLTKTNLSDDFQRFDVPLFYAEKVEGIGD